MIERTAVERGKWRRSLPIGQITFIRILIGRDSPLNGERQPALRGHFSGGLTLTMGDVRFGGRTVRVLDPYFGAPEYMPVMEQSQ